MRKYLLSKSLFIIFLGTTSATMSTGRIESPNKKRTFQQMVSHDLFHDTNDTIPPKKRTRSDQTVPPEVIDQIYSFLEKSDHKKMRLLSKDCNKLWHKTANSFVFNSSSRFLGWAFNVLTPPEDLYLKDTEDKREHMNKLILPNNVGGEFEFMCSRIRISSKISSYIYECSKKIYNLLPDNVSTTPDSWGESIHLVFNGTDTDQNANAFCLKNIQWTVNKFILDKLIKFEGNKPIIDEAQVPEIFEVLNYLQETFASCEELYGYKKQIKQFFSDCAQGQLGSPDKLKVFTEAIDNNKETLFRNKKARSDKLDVMSSLALAHLHTGEDIVGFLGSINALSKLAIKTRLTNKSFFNTFHSLATGHIDTTEKVKNFAAAVHENQNILFQTNGRAFNEVMTKKNNYKLMLDLAAAGLRSTDQPNAVARLFPRGAKYSIKKGIVDGLRIGNLKSVEQINK